MARARGIKPGLFKNEILGVADPLFTIAFEGLWCLADREGRLEDRPMRIHAEIFPYRHNVNPEDYLRWLADNGFIQRYSVGDKGYIQIVNFSKHQNPHKNEVESELPEYKELSPMDEVVPIKSEPLGLTPSSLTPSSLTPSSPEAPKKPARFDPTTLALPSYLKPEKWLEWIAYRKERKFPTTEATWKKQLGFLASQIGDPGEIIDASITNGWQGLFPPKDRGSSGRNKAEDRAYTGDFLTGRKGNVGPSSSGNEVAGEFSRIADSVD
jgi:hypothetical protein